MSVALHSGTPDVALVNVLCAYVSLPANSTPFPCRLLLPQAPGTGDAAEAEAQDTAAVVGETLSSVTRDAIKRGRETVAVTAAAVDGTREGQLSTLHHAPGPLIAITVECTLSVLELRTSVVAYFGCWHVCHER